MNLKLVGARAIIRACKLTATDERIDNVAMLAHTMLEYSITRPTQQAYVLATVAHECGFRSIPEIRARVGTRVRAMQDKYWHTGYYGRGFSQLTWKENYQQFSELLKVDLVNQPDLALNPNIGARILCKGMRDGLFTTHSLDDHLNDTKTDWRNARRIVNGAPGGVPFMHERVTAHALAIMPLLI